MSLLLTAAALLMATAVVLTQGQKALDIYVFDTEGGESVLYIAPSGEALLFDTGGGNAEANERDLNRILTVVKEAGVQVLDYVIVSHNHGDHVGNAADLPKLPIRNIRQFLDHGPYTTELQPNQRAGFERYLELRKIAKARRAEPGEKLSLGAVDVHVVASSGETITKPLAGAGAPNPLCAQHKPKRDVRGVENDEVVAVVVRYGSFGFLELSDMIWNHEQRLVCPANLIGTVDVYHTSGHADEWGSNPVMVHAVRPRVAVMNNAAVKGGHRDTFRTLRSSPGFQDVWQAHLSMKNATKEENAPEQFIANLDGSPGHVGFHIKISARSDGSFTVTNGRNGFSKDYPARTGATSSR
jgi:beta-lactamase superfamily II metal-dependent hydrolase